MRTVAGDYVESQLADRMDRPKLIGDIVTHWHKYGERRKSVAFTVNVAHSVHLRDEFIKSGVRAEHIDGSTPKPERDASLARLASGDIELVTNCMVLTEGWDMPEVGCCILARPTKKMGLFRQMIGRVLRPADGKTDAIVLDHSGAVFRHGFVEDPVEWTLDPDRRAESPTHRRARRTLCLAPARMHAVRRRPHRGRAMWPLRVPATAPRARSLRFEDGELAEVGRDRRINPNLYDSELRNRWHAMLVHIAIERDYKPGWAAHKYKEKFGAWPPWGARPQPIEPTPEVRSWVRSRQIAYAKSRNVA